MNYNVTTTLIVYFISMILYWIWLTNKYNDTKKHISNLIENSRFKKPISISHIVRQYIFNTQKHKEYVIIHYMAKNLHTLGRFEFLTESELEIRDSGYSGVFNEDGNLLFVLDVANNKHVKTLQGMEELDFSSDVLLSCIIGMSGFVVLSGQNDIDIISKIITLIAIFLMWVLPTIMISKLLNIYIEKSVCVKY